ncbi:hypothetical protein E0L93_10325 [Rubrobacter taiwanensis]|uniref:Uncharacterized protein n=1 Tax=Rubrobacter taiwanensis TaxID=185139 RepID=A0A4R1BGA5_9ACTN|nr:hypothetical protein [Rubrobacter taiwanensis]TCJ16219.1 hypothetical protein E0L93_10325 [Rubrobacter taiwanensis]
MESRGGETRERRVPATLEGAYELRDAARTSGERDFYQEHVYRLRAREYRSRGIRTRKSALRRERSRAEALRADGAGRRRFWWRRALGERK